MSGGQGTMAPVSRLYAFLLVFLLCNLGSAIGTWVAGFQIFDALS